MTRPAIAIDPRFFGRRAFFNLEPQQQPAQLSDDLRLFAGTFLSGFLFVSVLIA